MAPEPGARARRLGGAAARIVADAALASATLIGGTARSTQQALGLDAEYLARSLAASRGEFIWNRWQVPTLAPTARRDERVRRGPLQDFAGLLRGEPRSIISASATLTSSSLGTAHVGRAGDAPRDRRRLLHSPQSAREGHAISTTGATAGSFAARGPVRRAAAFLAVMTPRAPPPVAPALLALCAAARWRLSARRAARRRPWASSAGASRCGAPPAQVERRPNVDDLGMHAPHDMPRLRRSVVYLESAPRGAFPDPSRSAR